MLEFWTTIPSMPSSMTASSDWPLGVLVGTRHVAAAVLGGRQYFCRLYMYVYMRKVPDIKDPIDISMLSIDMENKENGSLDKENLVENGRPPDPADWAVTDVVNYFRTVGFEEQANAFQEQEIDGKSLLLMTRNDVLTGLSLKLGPALKIYEYHVKPLQTQHLKNSSL